MAHGLAPRLRQRLATPHRLQEGAPVLPLDNGRRAYARSRHRFHAPIQTRLLCIVPKLRLVESRDAVGLNLPSQANHPNSEDQASCYASVL